MVAPTDTAPLVRSDLSGDDQWTDEVVVTDSTYGVAVYGTFSGTVTVQLRPYWRDAESAWIDHAEYKKPAVNFSGPVKGEIGIRVGFKSGGYVSGTAVAMIYRGEDDGKRYMVTRAQAKLP